MSSKIDTLDHVFKTRYGGARIANQTERFHPRFRRMKKKGDFTGKNFAYNIRTGNPQAISGTLATTRTNATAAGASTGEQPKAYRFKKYGTLKLDGEAIAASEGDEGAFYDVVTLEIDGMIREMGDNFAFDLYRDSNGMRGRISAINGNVLTLANSYDVRNFKRNMVIIADDTITGLSPRSGTAKVTAMDESGSTITVDNAAGISGLLVNDYLFRDGDPGTCMEGLALCTPLVAPVFGSDTFRGFDRGADVSRLAGSRITDTSNSLEDRLSLGAISCQMVGMEHTPTEAYVNPLKFHKIVQRQNSKIMYSGGGGKATIGFEYIELATSVGVMKLHSDPDCPLTLAYGCLPDHEYIKHLRGVPHLEMDDGRKYIRSLGEDGLEVTFKSYLNYIQEDPADHFVVDATS
jgi:hypothetical protein